MNVGVRTHNRFDVESNMATDVLTSSILNYINHGSYPETEDISSARLSPSALPALLQQLREAQDGVENEIRTLSRRTAPDIDEWIARAKELQADILRSRDTARQIVQETEACDALKAEVEDSGKKTLLLEKEVQFNETLTGTLEHIQYANGLIDKAQDEAVVGRVEKALQRLEDAEASVAGLDGVRESRAVDALQQRAGELREGFVETSTECWNALVAVNVEEKSIRIRKKGLAADVPEAAVPEISLDAIVVGLKGLDVFDPLLQKLSRDIDRAILRPRMNVDDDVQVAKISMSGEELSCAGKSQDLSPASLFQDLRSIIEYLSSRLSHNVAIPLSSHLVPALTARLETRWLNPAIPVSISEMPAFQSLLTSVSSLADYISSLGWNGAEGLREWIQNAPQAWFTKRREVLLGEARNLVFTGLRGRKVVERVETRMVSREDAGLVGSGGDEGEDEWDTAWDDAEEEPGAAAQLKQEDPLNEDDDASAWDVDDDTSEDKSNNVEGEDDAWGWGDEENKTPSPVANRKAPPPSQSGLSTNRPNGQSPTQGQEMTLRETFTVTAIPEGILTILQATISDAQTLSGPDFSTSPIASVASALYTLPTLALAIYRATAPTAYNKLDVGNMLIYNDASRLADQLRGWQAAQPAASRLRVDKDVSALETFAKRAYSSEMEAQRTILRDLLDGAQGFANCTQQPFRAECEGAVEAAVDRLRDVHKIWKGVLSEGALLQSLGSLLATVTGKMISEIEELGDISEAESQQLKSLCDKVSSIKPLFTTPSPSPPPESTNAIQQGDAGGQDLTFIYCPSWLKFQYLAEILESSLADIRWMWKEGELSLEFGAEELVELVEALFAESELRRQAVREVRRGR